MQSKPFSITTPVEKVKKRCGVSRWKTASWNLCRFTHKGCVAPVALSAFEVELISTFEPAPRVLFFPLSHAGLGNNRWHFELHEKARAALQRPLEPTNERMKGEGRMALFFLQLSTRKKERLFPRCCCCCRRCWQVMATKCPLAFFQHTLFSAKRETNWWVETAKRCCCFASGKLLRPFSLGSAGEPVDSRFTEKALDQRVSCFVNRLTLHPWDSRATRRLTQPKNGRGDREERRGLREPRDETWGSNRKTLPVTRHFLAVISDTDRGACDL